MIHTTDDRDDEICRCIYANPLAIPLIWPKIKPDVMTCISKGGLGIHTPELVESNLCNGAWQLWELYNDGYPGKQLGFFILNVVPESHTEIAYGFIKSWVEGPIAARLKRHGLETIENMALAQGCSKVIAYSTRVGMDRVLSREMGYTKEMIIYCNEITKEDSSDRHGDNRPQSLPEDNSCDR